MDLSRFALYPHQAAGVEFLARRGRAILGDDMGLGKTRQAIIALRESAPTGVFLVICPASLKLNWAREIRLIYPDARIEVLGVAGEAHPQPQWVIVNYDLLARHSDRLRPVAWAGVVLDEAHFIKNASQRSSQALKILGVSDDKRAQVSGPRLVFLLTGTPMPNRPRDLFNRRRAVFSLLLANTAAQEGRGARPAAQDPLLGAAADQLRGGVERQRELHRLVPRLGRLAPERHRVPRASHQTAPGAAQGQARRLRRAHQGCVGERPEGARLHLLRRGHHPPQKDPRRSGRHHHGRVGLNLTAATHVIFQDLDWVPANHLQAEDRCYRIGQDRQVTVEYLLANGTLDSYIARLLEAKLSLVQAVEADEAPDASILQDLQQELIRLGPAMPRSSRPGRGSSRVPRTRRNPIA